GSTPRQIYLQGLLGLPQPRYAHLPVAVNAAGEKLSKQTFAAPVDAGNPLPALVAALSFLGQRPPQELTRGTIKELWDWAMRNWSLARVPRAATAPAPQM
ncbi:MAG: tRNA glutamyl-Q(34) synthetase GluQRS, partial [bacterium]